MTNRLLAIQKDLRALGWANGWLYLLNRVMERPTGGWLRLVKYDLMVQEARGRPLLPAHRGRNIHVREAGPADPLLSRVPGRSPETVGARFEAGARCLIAEVDQEFAGFLWFVRGDYAEDEVRCTFRPEPVGASVWDFDVFVAPRHRLSPVFLKLWQEANRLLQREDIVCACSRISAFNPSSRAAHHRLGAQRQGGVVFLCIGPWQLALGPSARLPSVSFGTTRPVIRVGLADSGRPPAS